MRDEASLDPALVEARASALGAQLFAPERPRLVAALAALTGAPEAVCREALYARGDPLRYVQGRHFAARARAYEGVAEAAAAWELCAPAEWIGAAGRRFVARDGALLEAPGDLRLALALASSPSGVATAEALAREVGARAAACVGGAAVGTLAWRLLEGRALAAFRPRWLAARGEDGGSLAARVALRSGPTTAASEAERACVAEGYRRALVPRWAGFGWDVAALAGLSAGCVARDALDAFGPALALCETGFALDDLDLERGVAWLVAPGW